MAKLKNVPKHMMPREKLIEKGSDKLRDSELLAVLLRTGIKGKNVKRVSSEILSKFPVERLLLLDYKELSGIKGIGKGKACSLMASLELAKRALEIEDRNIPAIDSAKDAVAQLQELRTAKREHLAVLYLDARNRLIHKETISVGTIDMNLAHPREIFKPAIDHLASSIIIAHNHPSGDAEPSDSDIEIAKKMIRAGKILDIDIADNLIITKDSWKRINVE